MTKVFAILLSIVACIAIPLAEDAFAQRSGRKSESRLPHAAALPGGFLPKGEPRFSAVTPNLVQYTPNSPVLTAVVDPSLSLSPAAQALYQQLATQINGWSTVPIDRTTFYSAFVNSQVYTIVQWEGLVVNATPATEGNVVTLAVSPRFAIPSVMSDPEYTEQLFVPNTGAIQYLGYSDPLGLSGQVPPEVIDF